jgi:hypothetical protein
MIPTYVIFSLRTLLDNPVIISPDYAHLQGRGGNIRKEMFPLRTEVKAVV